jgi:hypothetical protein
MAIGFNLPGIPSQIRGTAEEAGALPDLQQAIMQGFGSGLQMQYAPKQMAQDFLAKQLSNKMLGTQAQYAEPEAQAKLRLLEAQRAKALRAPVEKLGTYASALKDVKFVENQYGKDSIEAQQARNYAQNLSRSGGAKSGKLSQAEEKALAGGRVMDYLTPVIQENPYIGVNPTYQIAKDQYKYKFGSPQEKSEAKERLLKFGIASGLVSEQVAGTLLGQRITATVPALAHQRKSLTLGWPIGFEEQASLLPKEIQEQAKTEINKHLKNLKAMPEGDAMQKEASESDPLGIL